MIQLAEAALEKARATRAAAKEHHEQAAAVHHAMVAKITAGDATTTSPAELAAAAQEAEHAALVVQGTEVPLAELAERVKAARLDAFCDEVVSQIPLRQAAVLEALRSVEAALAQFEHAVAAHDQYTDDVRRRMGFLVPADGGTGRARSSRYGYPTVDRVSIRGCRGPAQLAKVITPVMRATKAPAPVITELRVLASEAPSLGDG